MIVNFFLQIATGESVCVTQFTMKYKLLCGAKLRIYINKMGSLCLLGRITFRISVPIQYFYSTLKFHTIDCEKKRFSSQSSTLFYLVVSSSFPLPE